MLLFEYLLAASAAVYYTTWFSCLADISEDRTSNSNEYNGEVGFFLLYAQHNEFKEAHIVTQQCMLSTRYYVSTMNG